MFVLFALLLVGFLLVAIAVGMSDFYAYSAMPGPGAVDITTERQALLGPITWYLLRGVVIDTGAVDAGNTPTTELRHGLLMGQLTSNGYWQHYQPNATNGCGLAQGFLWEARKTIDTSGNSVNRPAQVVMAGGLVKTSQVLLLDEQARRQLQNRFTFDDRLTGPIGGYTQTVAKTANYTVVNGSGATAAYIPANAGDNNTHFTTTGAVAEVDFTLGSPAKGNRFRFTNTVGQNMKVIGSANIVAPNNAAATTISFQTAGQLIGSSVEIEADETGTKWIALIHGPNAVTIS